jgi:predicted DCC family thiol-disulfide oxidoreductase YuxK
LWRYAQVLYGVDALNAMFEAVGLGWATKLGSLPLVSKAVDGLYDWLSSNRLTLGGAMDAVIAAKRVEMSKKGIETCGDMDEECAVEW